MPDNYPGVAAADIGREGQPFSMITLTDTQLYWYQVVSSWAPYFTVGSAILGGLSFINGLDQTAKLTRIEQELQQISNQIADLKASIFRLLDYQRLKDLADAVQAVQTNFSEIVRTRDGGRRGEIANACNGYISTILDRTGDGTIADDYRFAYASLLSTLLPLKLNIDQTYGVDMVGFPAEPDAPSELMKDDLVNRFLPSKVADLALANRAGAKRVSGVITTTRFIDPGPPRIYRTTYTYNSDGQIVFASAFQPPLGNAASAVRTANSLCAAAQNQKINETVAPLSVAYQDAENVLATLP